MDIILDIKETTMAGCRNHGCIIEEPEGMATNGRCRCLDGLPFGKRVEVSRTIIELRLRVKALEQELIEERHEV